MNQLTFIHDAKTQANINRALEHCGIEDYDERHSRIVGEFIDCSALCARDLRAQSDREHHCSDCNCWKVNHGRPNDD